MANTEERLRRTMMFVPGNNPAMIKDAGIYGADSIMFDLEDAVSMPEKDAARYLVYEALKTMVMLNWLFVLTAWTRHISKMILRRWSRLGWTLFVYQKWNQQR